MAMSQWSQQDYNQYQLSATRHSTLGSGEEALSHNSANSGGTNSAHGKKKLARRDNLLLAYWNELRSRLLLEEPNFREHALPLARIKKVMKTDSLLKGLMISYEVPVIFSKGAEAFVEELTIRAWTKAEASSRRTLQKPDIIEALNDSEMYDFLIDIVPRERGLKVANLPLGFGKSDAPPGPKSALPVLETSSTL